MAHSHHLARAPFAIESFPGGFAIIVDANGINWGLDGSGAVGFSSVEGAQAWAEHHQLEMRHEEAGPTA